MICAYSFWVGLGDIPMLSGRLLRLLDCGFIVSVRGLGFRCLCCLTVVSLFYSDIGWLASVCLVLLTIALRWWFWVLGVGLCLFSGGIWWLMFADGWWIVTGFGLTCVCCCFDWL